MNKPDISQSLHQQLRAEVFITLLGQSGIIDNLGYYDMAEMEDISKRTDEIVDELQKFTNQDIKRHAAARNARDTTTPTKG